MPAMACHRRLLANLAMTIGSIAAPRPDIATLRRAALFLVNVGFPIVAAAVLGEWRIALVGGVAAIMLSFADDDGPLPSRLVFLVEVAFGMAAGAAAGHWLGGYGTGFWILFIAAAFAAGLLHRAGRAAHMAARVRRHRARDRRRPAGREQHGTRAVGCGVRRLRAVADRR